ncbi:MAG: hypothetical protein AAGI01_08455 [Myxococcota bacterium]
MTYNTFCISVLTTVIALAFTACGGTDIGSSDDVSDLDAPAPSTPDASADAQDTEDMGPQCPAEQPDFCERRCTDVRTDRRNCGGCDVRCDRGEQCFAGTCRAPDCRLDGCTGFTWCDPSDGVCREGCERDTQCRQPAEVCARSMNTCVCAAGYAACAQGCCPDVPGCIQTAVTARAREGSERAAVFIAVGDLVTLDAKGTRSPSSELEDITWSFVERPVGSFAPIVQDEKEAARARFTPDVLGDYIIEIGASDTAGTPMCSPRARAFVTAIDDPSFEAMRVELTWETTQDPDLNDEFGADLDLHVLHPLGRWNEAPWSISWENPTADWGSRSDPRDDPELIRQDDDGEGPEIIRAVRLSDAGTYRVGVFYYDDNGYGASSATLRLYLDGRLTVDIRNRTLASEDIFWDVLSFERPSNQIRISNDFLQGIPPGP